MLLNIFCECLLVLAAVLAAVRAWRVRMPVGSIGYLLIGIASVLGIFEYAGLSALADAHRTASRLSTQLALPLIAIGSLRHVNGLLVIIVAIAAGIVLLLLPSQATVALNILSLAAIVYANRKNSFWMSLAGALLFAGAGLFIGTRGEWHGVPRVDLFHVALALALSLWVRQSGRRMFRSARA
jgi:hypothetical protein